MILTKISSLLLAILLSLEKTYYIFTFFLSSAPRDTSIFTAELWENRKINTFYLNPTDNNANRIQPKVLICSSLLFKSVSSFICVLKGGSTTFESIFSLQTWELFNLQSRFPYFIHDFDTPSHYFTNLPFKVAMLMCVINVSANGSNNWLVWPG